ncbi:MAG: ribonuclease Z [Spirochaetota bacterium]|nr:ribonuclease Z [Spirochaetota bacterium]
MFKIWQGENIKVEVLYSKAGIATQILLTDTTNEYKVLMDCGDGTARDLIERSINLNEVKGILLTHGHPDHVGGLFSFLSTLNLIQYKGELTIFAPSSCKEAYSIIKLFLNLYGKKIGYTLNYNELYSGVFEGIGNFIIKPFDVLHYESDKPPLKKKASFGYRVSLFDEVIVYSGDTVPCLTLEKEVEGVDFALLEATYEEKNNDKTANHLDKEYAEYIGKSAKNYLLIHKR